MAYFEVVGILQKTNRKRTKQYIAVDEQQAKTLAEGDGITPQSVSLVPAKPATEKQINYARDLGLSFPSDINISEMSHLISRKVDEDIEAPLWFYEYALSQFPEQNGIGISKYIGLRALLEFLGFQYKNKGDTNGLIKLFIYSVTNELKNTRWQTPFNQLISDDIVSSLVEELSKDPKVITSVKKYSADNFVFFGDETDKEGWSRTGGSRRTTAFKTVAELLTSRGIVSHRPAIKHSGSGTQKYPVSSASKSGCLIAVVSLAIVVSIIIATLV